MAVVDRIITLPDFAVPATRPCLRRVAPELATPVFEDKIYIAPGKNVKEGKAKIIWTVHQSGGNVKICIIHVLVPSQTIPMGGLGAGMPANSANEIVLREHRENELTNMHKILDKYLLVCRQMGVSAEKEFIVSDSVQKGIVELVRSQGIRKLVMGAAADGRYSKKMTELKSKKAIFVRDKVDASCQIRFICNGHLIHTREAQTVPAIPTDAPSLTTSKPRAGKSILRKSQSAPFRRNGSAKLSNPFQDILKRAISSISDQRPVMPIASPSPDITPSEHPNTVRMLEGQDTLQELATNLSHQLQLIQSAYHTVHSSLPNTVDMDENGGQGVTEVGVTTPDEAEVDIIEGRQKDPRKLEEELEKVKDQLNKVMEELRSALDQKLQLESQFAETEEGRRDLELKISEANEMLQIYRQERELLQIELDNVLKAEEVCRRERDSSGTNYFSEFSITEIKEATQNFHPSRKIGEGGCGSVYKGVFRHTWVAVKKIKFHGMNSSKQFQQEVDVLSKVRHPNLITLMGACPEPCTLVYEYVPNGSLEDWLHSNNRARQLPWQARIRIATELCSVLAYLHSWKPHSIVHGDVKPGNILLDEHLGTKLSDFGISRLLSGDERSSNNTTVLYTNDLKGTLGYMDPEILVTRELTTKFDVFSLGIILLQLLTRKLAFGITKEVQNAIKAGTLGAILDPLAGEWPYMQAEKLTHLALSCCKMSRRDRPDLRHVLSVLKSIRASCSQI